MPKEDLPNTALASLVACKTDSSQIYMKFYNRILVVMPLTSCEAKKRPLSYLDTVQELLQIYNGGGRRD